MRYLFFFLLACLFLFVAQSLHARIIHVPGDSTTIQGGINGALDGDTVMVDPGTYYEYDINFLGKAITVMGTDPGDSTVVANTVIDADMSGNVFVFISGEDSTSVLAGFTITGAYAIMGGGIYCFSSSPVIKNNMITQNGASVGGGGMMNCASSPTITNCTFHANSTYWLDGGGIYGHLGSETLIHCSFTGNMTPINCTFSENPAFVGGGMYNVSNSAPRVTNCTFSANSSKSNGGGMYNDNSSSPTVNNCVFIGNSAIRGAGIYNGGYASVSNCTFAENLASGIGGGMYNGSPTVTNCILWGDIPDEFNGNPIVTYSDVEGGYPGEGNIDADPPFVTFHGFDYLLRRGSPCIDAGDPTLEDGREWPAWYNNGLRSDMGAYGGPGNVGWLRSGG